MLKYLLPAVLFATPATASCFAIDGDTLACGQERIRIMGLDAPETYRAKCNAEFNAGKAAKQRMARLIDSKALTIKRRGKDRYKRTLATVRVNGRDVAEIMINLKLARPYHGKRRQPWCEVLK